MAAEIIKFRILLLAVAAALISQNTEAAEHVVDWIIPSSNVSSSYTNFSASTPFILNDTIVFNFKTGVHNVVTLTKKNYDKCNVSDQIESFDKSPATIKLNRTGEFYFTCAFPFHCSLGQKLSINVTAKATSALTPPSPSGSPTQSMSLSATLSVLLYAVAITVLF